MNGLSHLGDSISRGMESIKKNSQLHSKMAGRDAPVYSKGVRELDNHGYERYNIDDDGEIFISRMSEKALFNDGDPLLVRATDGNFVGSSDPFSRSDVKLSEPVPAPEDARSLFKNVPISEPASNTYVGTVGINNGGHIEPVTDNSFLKKMARVENTRPAPSISVEEPVDEPVIEEVSEEDVKSVADGMPSIFDRMVKGAHKAEPAEEVDEAPEAPAAEPEVFEEPAEVPEHEPVLNEDVFIGMPVKPRDEFFIDAEDTEVPEELDCDRNVEEDDIYYDYLDDDYAGDTEEVFVAESPEVPVAESEEAPFATPAVEADEPVIEAVEDVPVIEENVIEAAEPEVVEAPAEEPVIETAEVPVVEESVIEEPAEAPVADVPIESIVEQEAAEALVSEAVVNAVVDEVIASESVKEAEPEVIEGLHVEGNERSSGASVGNVAMAAVAGPAPSTAVTGAITADGEALPPMSDPVITRPRSSRSARFKFSNGRIVNVDNEESKEGLQSPLE